jgi:NIMA (never in mitosis gene a)-related kinase
MARSCFEDFVIEGKLGSGSFGTVFKVTRKADGQQYALKEIDLRCMSEQEQEDCIKECSVLASLDSPHIIKFYDSFLQKVRFWCDTMQID